MGSRGLRGARFLFQCCSSHEKMKKRKSKSEPEPTDLKVTEPSTEATEETYSSDEDEDVSAEEEVTTHFELEAAVDNAKLFFEQFQLTTLPTSFSEVKKFLEPFCVVPFSIPANEINAFLHQTKILAFEASEDENSRGKKKQVLFIDGDAIRDFKMQKVADVIIHEFEMMEKEVFVVLCMFEYNWVEAAFLFFFPGSRRVVLFVWPLSCGFVAHTARELKIQTYYVAQLQLFSPQIQWKHHKGALF
jgi:hypothetical protein